jgi:hypothetical protein
VADLSTSITDVVGAAVDTVSGTVGAVTELAGEGLSTVGSAVSSLSDEQGRRLGRLVLLILVVLAVVGVVAWRRSQCADADDDADVRLFPDQQSA